jgi:hypothetical protein
MIILAAALLFLHQRGYLHLPTENKLFRGVFSLGWLYRMLWWVYQSTSRLVAYLANLMEGEGGVFWAALIMILLVTVILQRSRGG